MIRFVRRKLRTGMLKIGDRAPDFALPDDRGEVVRLSDLLREGPLVLYFYPADFTPVCTREACMFRDMHSDLAAQGMQVIGISPQPPSSHEKFRGTYSLPFRLLSDPERVAIRAYGADGFLGLVRRISYLIAADGRILDAVQAAFQVGKHKDFARRALEAR